MNSKLVCVFFGWLISTLVIADKQQVLIEDSRQSVQFFGKQLKSQLQQGMQNGGPVNAIHVCHTAADKISTQLSEQYGWKISRTSLKARNANNTPDSWEKRVLQNFEQRKNKGEAINQLESAEIINGNNTSVFRYMKAIPTQGICLSCHGEKLLPELTKTVDELYPDDKATGYSVGDIRGAFTITRQLK